MSHKSTSANSPLLRALDHALAQARAEEAAAKAPSNEAPPYASERARTRGIPDVGAIPAPVAPPASAGMTSVDSPSDILLGQLADVGATVSAQIASVQRWLSQHPDLLRLFDAGMRQEFQQMERRTNRKNILFNAAFTVLGALLGLVLPYLITNLPSILAHNGGR